MFNKLPRLIAIIFEDDLAEAIKVDNFGISEGYEKILKWLLREYTRSILTIKEKLPKKSIRTDWPHLLLIAPSIHKNYHNDKFRRKFTHALEKVVWNRPQTSHVSTLRLGHTWDQEDGNLFLAHQQRFTDKGVSTLWQAIDKAIRFCITKLDENDDNRRVDQFRPSKNHFDRFHKKNFYSKY